MPFQGTGSNDSAHSILVAQLEQGQHSGSYSQRLQSFQLSSKGWWELFTISSEHGPQHKIVACAETYARAGAAGQHVEFSVIALRWRKYASHPRPSESPCACSPVVMLHIKGVVLLSKGRLFSVMIKSKPHSLLSLKLQSRMSNASGGGGSAALDRDAH